jgi:hypothetical protein
MAGCLGSQVVVQEYSHLGGFCGSQLGESLQQVAKRLPVYHFGGSAL